MAWKDRIISGPDEDFISPDQLRRLVALSEDVFEQLQDDGVVPPPIRTSKRTLLHPWRHAVYLALWLEYFGPDYFARAEQKKKPGEVGGG